MCISWIRSDKSELVGVSRVQIGRTESSDLGIGIRIGKESTSLEIDASDKRSALVFYLGSYRIINKRLDRKSQLLKPTCFPGIEPRILVSDFFPIGL